MTEAPTASGAAESPATRTTFWYLVHTKPRQENIALTNLERQGYACYLPQMRIERVRRGKALVVTEAMFPRYLFIQLDSSDQAKSWAPIRSTLGVNQLVRFGAQAARVDDALVDLLREREQAKPLEALFCSGDTVVITQGPFAGIEAIYQTADAERRALILLEIMSRKVEMRVEAGELARVEKRVLTLQELDMHVGSCRFTKDDETFSYNHHITKLMSIAELHRSRSGVSKGRIFLSFNVNLVRSTGALACLKVSTSKPSQCDKQFTKDRTRILRSMKAATKVEAGEQMA